VLDVTVCSSGLCQMLTGGQVSDDDTLSDHRLIECQLEKVKIPIQWKRNPARTVWPVYLEHLEHSLPPLTYPKSMEAIEEYTCGVTKAIVTSFEKACP